jgi:hypothetical protein
MKEFKNLVIEPTSKTPQIDLNPLTGELIFAGRSIPENAATVYESALKWVKEYISKARPTTNFRLNMEYFNTSSSIWLAKILKVLSKINDPDYVLIVHLYFNIEEFDEMDVEELKDALIPITDIIHDAIPSIGIKVYGTDDNGKIIKDTLIFI